jgi:predicted TIM-barrel fold metal-dependent hydrolase
MNTTALPPELQRFAGRILDVDSHEMIPAQRWIQEFGPVASNLTECFLHNGETARESINHPNVPDFIADDRPIEPDTVWREKGCCAPGAVEPARRLEVMDTMGVARQLMFPTSIAFFGVTLAVMPNENLYQCMSSINGDRRAAGKALIHAYRDWGMRAGRVSDRVRPVLPVLADSPDELMEETARLLAGGIRAIWLPSSAPPGGRSPAHPDLDPFWKQLTDARATACLHIGGEGGTFLSETEWGNAPAFDGFRALGEFRVDPWTLSLQHLPSQNFLATAVVGGVFERHPELRFGVIETGANWIGPLLQNLDLYYEQSKAFARSKAFTSTAPRLPAPPSFYIRRNVRVSAFDFEPVDLFIERYGLEDVLCFSTDYPHIEGGKDPARRMYDCLARLGPEVVEKFFVKNGEWLLPI